jgi:CheY-like chemotaxis protein
VAGLKIPRGATDNTKVPQTLLLADDSVTIQRVIELTFADEAIKVVAVSDGDQAIARIEADPPDIVLVDIGMPGRTGYEVAQHVKQSSRLKHIPVLLLTGAFEPVDQAKAMAVGCDGVLAKPFEPQLVIARVKELLGGNGGGAKATAAPKPAAALASNDDWGFSRPDPANDAKSPAQVARLDDYFEQLDAKFQTLGEKDQAGNSKTAATGSTADIIDWFAGAGEASAAPADLPLSANTMPVLVPPVLAVVNRPIPEPAPKALTAVAPQPVVEAASNPGAGAAPHTVAEAAPHAAGEPPSPTSAERAAEAAPPTVANPAPKPTVDAVAKPGSLPAIGDAFAAILAAEQRDPIAATATAWPVGLPAAPNGSGELNEATIEEITRRVIDRLSDRVVRDTAAEIISAIAERLVREEIERIKSAIK